MLWGRETNLRGKKGPGQANQSRETAPQPLRFGEGEIFRQERGSLPMGKPEKGEVGGKKRQLDRKSEK